jgi:hypothetical protein
MLRAIVAPLLGKRNTSSPGLSDRDALKFSKCP